MVKTVFKKALSFAGVRLGVPLALLLLAASWSPTAEGPENRARGWRSPYDIVGTWLVTATADDPTKLPAGFPPVFEGVETFNVDGTMNVVVNLPGVTLGSGVWKPTGPDRYTFTFSFYRLDSSTNNPFGSYMLGATVMENVLLTNGGNNYITTDVIRDLNGNLSTGTLIGEFPGTVSAKRYPFATFNTALPHEP